MRSVTTVLGDSRSAKTERQFQNETQYHRNVTRHFQSGSPHGRHVRIMDDRKLESRDSLSAVLQSAVGTGKLDSIMSGAAYLDTRTDEQGYERRQVPV